MKKSRPVSALIILVLSLSLPAPAFAAGGKSSAQHEQARAAKQTADEAAPTKADASAKAGRSEAGDDVTAEKKKVWTRRVRHKQTMPPAPNFEELRKGARE